MILPILISKGVSAISILTEKTRFGGSLSDLKEVASICKNNNVPCCKKILFLTFIKFMRVIMASAALIIVSILDEKELNQSIIQRIVYNPLVEIFNKYELNLALDNGADVIGINNRNK